jgi:hypothetical protein
MKLRFRIGPLTIGVVAIGAIIFMMLVLLNVIVRHPEKINGLIIGVTTFFIGTILILFREMKFKWNAIEINDIDIIVSPFLGLGHKRRIRFSEVTTINKSWEPSKISDGYVIYIYEDNKRTIEISDAYCKNFLEISDELNKKLKGLGTEDSRISKNIMNAFGVPIKLTPKQNER